MRARGPGARAGRAGLATAALTGLRPRWKLGSAQEEENGRPKMKREGEVLKNICN